MQKIILKVTEKNNDVFQDDIECYLFSSDLDSSYLKKASSEARERSKITLLFGDKALELARDLDVDGVIVDLSKSENIKKDYAEIKKQLKQDSVIGVITRNRRHEAMIVSEQEPDFVVFRAWNDGVDKVKELVSWYSEFFLIQSAILLEDDMNYADFQSDMVILSKKSVAK